MNGRDEHAVRSTHETDAYGKGIDAGGKRENESPGPAGHLQYGLPSSSPRTPSHIIFHHNGEQDKRNPVIIRRDEPDYR